MDLVLCCELKCRFILVGLINCHQSVSKAGWFDDLNLLDHRHGKSIKINVSYRIGILGLILFCYYTVNN